MKTKRLINNILFYFMGTFATKILQILFIPIYSIYINTSDYGYYNLILSILTLSIPVLYQSIWEGVLRFVIDKEENAKKILASTSIYCFGLTIIYSLLFLVFSQLFDIKYGLLILLMAIGQMGSSYWQFSARAMKENKVYSISTVVNTALTILLNLVLILVFKWGIQTLFIANTLGNFAMVLVIESRLKLIKQTRISLFDKDIIKAIIRYSLPLCINAISWWLISSCNSLIISYKLGMDQNGIYSMAVRFGSIMQLVTSVVNMAWIEESFRTFGEKDSDKYFNNILNLLIRAVLSGVALLIPVTYIFYQLLVHGDYISGVYLTPIIYLNAAFTAFASHLGSGFLARKESNIIFRTTLISGLFSAISGYLTADILGLTGVVVASLLGTILMFVMRIPMLKKRMDLRINYIVTIGLTLFTVLLLVICNFKAGQIMYQAIILVITTLIVSIINKDLLFLITNKVKFVIKKGGKI